MVNYDGIEEMINTTENMEHLVNNVSHDDDTMTFDGVDWFVFNQTIISRLYVSGNSWLGLGVNAEQLLVCRRDTKMWHFYREEATIFGAYRVLKIRWEGYAQYNSTSSDVALAYEWFFIENGDMYLHIIKAPKSSGYLGTSRINGGMTQNFTVEAGKEQDISFYHVDEEGKQYRIEYERIEVLPPFDRRYLLSGKDEKLYRVEHEKAFVDAICFNGHQLIRTGVIPNQDTRVRVRFQTDIFGDFGLFGARENTSKNKFAVFLTSSTQIQGQYATQSITEEVDNYSGIEVTVELSAEGLKRDDVVIAEYDLAEFETPCELTIGTLNGNGVLDSRYYQGKIYQIEVWQGEEQLLDLVPCVDERVHPCFYDIITETCFYNEGSGKFGYEDSEKKVEECTHLIEVEVEEITAEVFKLYGFEDFPTAEVLLRIPDPQVLYWQDSEIDLPIMRANMNAIPPVQTIYSKNTLMNDSTILGIEKVSVEADETTLFAFSFDGGETWKAYIENMWVNLSEETSGMTKESVEAIGTDAWTIANEQMQYMVRFTLIEGGYVNRIIVHYIN